MILYYIVPYQILFQYHEYFWSYGLRALPTPPPPPPQAQAPQKSPGQIGLK